MRHERVQQSSYHKSHISLHAFLLQVFHLYAVFVLDSWIAPLLVKETTFATQTTTSIFRLAFFALKSRLIISKRRDSAVLQYHNLVIAPIKQIVVVVLKRRPLSNAMILRVMETDDIQGGCAQRFIA